MKIYIARSTTLQDWQAKPHMQNEKPLLQQSEKKPHRNENGDFTTLGLENFALLPPNWFPEVNPGEVISYTISLDQKED